MLRKKLSEPKDCRIWFSMLAQESSGSDTPLDPWLKSHFSVFQIYKLTIVAAV